MNNEQWNKFKKQWLPIIYLIVGLFMLRWSLIEPYVVPTGSMEPSLKPGDRLYALKCAYDIRIPFTEKILFRTGDVKRGDVILFRAPRDPGLIYVKRAIGLAGDRISFRDGKLFVNGQEIYKEPTEKRDVMYDIPSQDTKTLYIENLEPKKHWVVLDRKYDRSLEEQERHARIMDERVVPAGHFFAVGDNRDESWDSRAWGFVPYENLKGRAMFIWYSSRQPIDVVHHPEMGWGEWTAATVVNLIDPRPERIGIPIR